MSGKEEESARRLRISKYLVNQQEEQEQQCVMKAKCHIISSEMRGRT